MVKHWFYADLDHLNLIKELNQVSDQWHETYMRRCLQLARCGELKVAPNPMAGSVIVHNGLIIGEGFHQSYGGPHAEVNAIHSVQDKALLKDATIYVNLEPCSHFGKTPPCADLIVQLGIPRVVIGSLDPNPQVAGKGIERLKAHGIEVIKGVLDDECRHLNRRFFTFHEKKRPFITLKWAQTQDGFIDKKRSSNDVGVNWITGDDARVFVHHLRAQHAAILIGTNTALNDNPTLTVREVEGSNPLRVIIDRERKIPSDSNVLNQDAKTLVFTEKEHEIEDHVEWFHVDFSNELPEFILAELYRRNIQSVMVEGGAFTLSQLIHKGLWDEAVVLKGNISFGDGIHAPEFKGMLYSERKMTTCMVEFYC